jgi:hypothetical protein
MKLDLFTITILLAIILMFINLIKHFLNFGEVDILNSLGVIIFIIILFKRSRNKL